VVGRGRAVCEIRGRRLKGPLAFLTYLSVHLFYLGGGIGQRIATLVAWASASFGNRQSRVIKGELPSAMRGSVP
jgi:hypothetical protein